MQTIKNQYTIDPLFLGYSSQRQTRTYYATKYNTKNNTNEEFAIKVYQSDSKPRQLYDQWIDTQPIKEENGKVVCEIMPLFIKDLEIVLNNQESFEHTLDIMIMISKNLLIQHKKGKIHGNIHPKNILFTQDLKTVQFFDSLKGGNNQTYYSSPQYDLDIYTPAVDVWSLGITFIELLVEEPMNQQLMGYQCPPYLQPLFPQKSFLQKVKNEQMRNLIKQMLNRNYQERISLANVVSSLAKIKKKQALPLQKNYPKKYTEFRLKMIDDQKKQMMKQFPKQTKPFPRSNNVLLQLYQKKDEVVFTKNGFEFVYSINKNMLQIQYIDMSLAIIYKEKQLPLQIRTIMDLPKFFLILYHTPDQRFQFCTNGELLVRASSNFESMVFNFPDKLNQQ